MSATNSLRLNRIARGMTQATLAKAAGISQQLMSKLEAGTIALTPERAQVFAAILGCKAIDLLPAFANQPTPEGSEETELLRIYRELDPSRRGMLMNMARAVRMEMEAATRPNLRAIAN